MRHILIYLLFITINLFLVACNTTTVRSTQHEPVQQENGYHF